VAVGAGGGRRSAEVAAGAEVAVAAQRRTWRRGGGRRRGRPERWGDGRGFLLCWRHRRPPSISSTRCVALLAQPVEIDKDQVRCMEKGERNI
jgi:hypothetical protein